jgi:transcriptional regulator with XRE-family HTH domain
VAFFKRRGPLKKEAKVDQDKRLLYALVFADMNLDQAGFADATRTAASQVSAYLHGKRTVPRAVLERALEAVRFPKVLMQPALRAIRSYRAATRGWSRRDRVLSETFFAELLAWSGEALETIFLAAAPTPARRIRSVPSEVDRDLAAGLWLRLERRNAGQRLAMVEEIEDFQSRALYELVAAKSIEMAPGNPVNAQELAELALRIAEHCPAPTGSA